MSKQVSLPKISLILQKLKIGPKRDTVYAPFGRNPSFNIVLSKVSINIIILNHS